ncbi:MAG: hypothetical protein R2879_08940 [Saprospiraceae bacterium]
MNAEILEYIEDYLDNKIDRNALEAKAASLGVSDLASEIEFVENTRLAVEAAGLRNQLDALIPNASQKENIRKQKSPLKLIIGVAASVLIIVVGYWAFFDSNNLYKDYAYVDPGLPVTMGESENYALDDALTYFGEGNYKVSLEKLLAISEKSGSNDTVSYFIGASYLYENQTEKAREYLMPVVSDSSSVFSQKAEWLLVLAALREDKMEKAKEQASQIANSESHAFQEEAEKLLLDLKGE